MSMLLTITYWGWSGKESLTMTKPFHLAFALPQAIYNSSECLGLGLMLQGNV